MSNWTGSYLRVLRIWGTFAVKFSVAVFALWTFTCVGFTIFHWFFLTKPRGSGFFTCRFFTDVPSSFPRAGINGSLSWACLHVATFAVKSSIAVHALWTFTCIIFTFNCIFSTKPRGAGSSTCGFCANVPSSFPRAGILGSLPSLSLSGKQSQGQGSSKYIIL